MAGLGNWGLPEFGITEFFGGKRSSLAAAKTNKRSLSTHLANNYVSGGSSGSVQGVSDQRDQSDSGSSRSNQSNSGSSQSSKSSNSGSSKSSSQKEEDNRRRDAERKQREYEDQVRGNITSGWDDYMSSLDQQFAGLNDQRVAQEGIASGQYNQGVNSLGLQREQGMQSLGQNRAEAEQNQATNLRDISGNIRNAFQAGNVYLGARGSGDSSAADQYSFALNKMATKQRSNVMSDTSSIMDDINARETNLNNIYNTETNNLEQQKNTQIQQIASWFADAQNQVRQAKASGQLGKSRDLQSLSKDMLNQAIQAVNQINSEITQRKQMLEQWAMGISDNINSLKSNMQGISQFDPNLPQSQSLYGNPQVSPNNGSMYYPGGSSEEQEKGLFGY